MPKGIAESRDLDSAAVSDNDRKHSDNSSEIIVANNADNDQINNFKSELDPYADPKDFFKKERKDRIGTQMEKKEEFNYIPER
jgi:hypothetical protein